MRAAPPHLAASRGFIAAMFGACVTATLALGAGPAHAQPQHAGCLSAHAEGQRQQLAGRLLGAREQLLVCAQAECPKLISRDCTVWLSEVDAALSSVVFAVVDAQGRDLVDVRVFSDGALIAERADGRAQTLDPGLHEFRFEAEGHEPLRMTLPIRQSERNRIIRAQLLARRPALPPPADTSASRPAVPTSTRRVPIASYVLGSVALAGFGAFAYFGLDGRAEYDAAAARCAPSCSASEVESGRRAYVLADVGLGIGVAATAAAVIVYFATGERDEPAAEPRARARVVPALSPDAASLRLIAHY